MTEETIGLGIKAQAERLKTERLNLKREREALEQERARLEERQRSLDDELKSRTLEIEAKTRELAEKESELEKGKKELYLAAEELEKKRAEIEEMSRKFSATNLREIEEKIRDMEKREADIAEKARNVDMKSKAFLEAEKTMNIREEELAKKQAFLIEREKELIEREDAARQKMAAMNQRETALIEREKAMAEKLDGLLSSEVKGMVDSIVDRFNSLESDMKNSIINAIIKEEDVVKRSRDIDKELVRIRDLERRLIEREEAIMTVEKELELLLSGEIERDETDASGLEVQADFTAKAEVHEAIEGGGQSAPALREPDNLPEEPGVPGTSLVEEKPPTPPENEPAPTEPAEETVEREEPTTVDENAPVEHRTPPEPEVETEAEPEIPTGEAAVDLQVSEEVVEKPTPEVPSGKETEKMLCPVCGAEIEAGAGVCPVCGQDLVSFYMARSEEMINNAQKHLAEVHNMDIDITNLKSVLNQAKAARNDGDFRKALELAEECIAEANRVMGRTA